MLSFLTSALLGVESICDVGEVTGRFPLPLAIKMLLGRGLCSLTWTPNHGETGHSFNFGKDGDNPSAKKKIIGVIWDRSQNSLNVSPRSNHGTIRYPG
jgi:hypothetical protein